MSTTNDAPRKYRIVFRGKTRPDGPWAPDGRGGQMCISTIAYMHVQGAVFGTTPDEISAAIKENYPRVYEYEITGLDNQRLDYEMIYGMASADCKFADSYYA